MKIYTDSSEFIKNNKCAITVGSFDGLHLGHFKIIEELLKVSKQINGESVLLTFEPHPRSVISKNYDIKILTSLDEKKTILKKAGIDNLIVQNFTEEFSQLTSDEFIRNILVDQIGVSNIVVGHDHRFGKDRLGDAEKLKDLGSKYNFDVTSVPAEMIDGEILSSSKIRNALFEGDIDKANFFLGRDYAFGGTIVKGAQRGRTLGFPTANIKLFDPRKAIPKNGVYAVSCRCQNEGLKGVMNIGVRPTFENNHELVIEVHLINFNRDIYGAEMTVDIIKRMRDERKFESKDDLIHQIEIDKQTAIKLLT